MTEDGSSTATQSTPNIAEAQSEDVEKSKVRSHCQETAATTPVDDVITSEPDNDESERSDDDKYDADAGISSKSLTSYASSSTKPKSFNSSVSQQSISSTSSSKDEFAPSSEDIRRVREQLQNSLQEEMAMLGMQQQLLGELEEVEHAIIKAKMKERSLLVASQQAHVTELLTRGDIAV